MNQNFCSISCTERREYMNSQICMQNTEKFGKITQFVPSRDRVSTYRPKTEEFRAKMRTKGGRCAISAEKRRAGRRRYSCKKDKRPPGADCSLSGSAAAFRGRPAISTSRAALRPYNRGEVGPGGRQRFFWRALGRFLGGSFLPANFREHPTSPPGAPRLHVSADEQ